jgi:hypothetical protein
MGNVPSSKEILHARIAAVPWRPHVVSIFSKKVLTTTSMSSAIASCTDDHTPWALLVVYLKEVEHPEQMLRVPTPWLELVMDDELPDKPDDTFACSKELAKEPGLRGGLAPISS